MTNKLKNSGFTLIELTLVMAISSLLLVLVFQGWSTMLQRSRFDTAIDQTVQDISYTRNYALSNDNQTGPGNTTTSAVAGTGLEFDANDPLGYLVELEPLYADYDASGNFTGYVIAPNNDFKDYCDPANDPSGDGECFEMYFHTLQTSQYKIYDTAGNPMPEIEIYYIHNPPDDPGTPLEVCTSSPWNTPAYECSHNAGTMDLVFENNDGLKATIEINGTTGIPKRLN